MVRALSIDKNGMKKGEWSKDEDNKLTAYITRYGHWNWRELPKYAGLSRSGKSCRLRWLNYLKPGVKRGNYNKEEDDIIIKLYDQLGPKWSTISKKLPGRTDNEIKNYWHTHLKKRRKIEENPNSLKKEGEGSSVTCQLEGKQDKNSSQIIKEIIQEKEIESSSSLSSPDLAFNQHQTSNIEEGGISLEQSLPRELELFSLSSSSPDFSILDYHQTSCTKEGVTSPEQSLSCDLELRLF